MTAKKKLAIIGSGISGLTVAFELHQQFDITVFEKEPYFGGHTDTHNLLIDGKSVNIDSGFIIFCPEYYPNFDRMLRQLNVARQKTDMSFSVFNPNRNLLYNASTLSKIFCQLRNLVRPRFYRMLVDIVRFYSTAHRVLDNDKDQGSVADYLQSHSYGKEFSESHLLPMISALWSATPNNVLAFPIQHLVEFFQNHGLLKLVNRPQWYVIKGGSRSYVDALRESLEVTWRSNYPIAKVKRGPQVEVISRDNQAEIFDAVVFATHADQAVALLDKPSAIEREVLGAMPFQKNHVLVHTDSSLLHPNKRSWGSWNVRVPSASTQMDAEVCTANYWMNSLQSLELETQVFTSLNNQQNIDQTKILAEREYEHPIFTQQSVAAQSKKSQVDGVLSSYYVGAYWGWGFHEDGARSAVQVSQLIREQLA